MVTKYADVQKGDILIGEPGIGDGQFACLKAGKEYPVLSDANGLYIIGGAGKLFLDSYRSKDDTLFGLTRKEPAHG